MPGGLLGAHYVNGRQRLHILAAGWRPPQRGALGAVVSHWSVDPDQAALVSVPTGSGKTAVALALPYLAEATRTLVLVPSQPLREQMAAEFRTEADLLAIGAIEGREGQPCVEEIAGRDTNWDAVEQAEVFVALPYSLVGPEGGNLPGAGYFDLIIMDEAHHAPAATWREVLDHFPDAKVVLLTATPRRRDGKALPGKHVFHFPLRRAIDDGYYIPVEPRILPVPIPLDRIQQDRLIADALKAALTDPTYANAAALVRVSTIERATVVAELYQSIGVDCVVVHSRMTSGVRRRAIDDWRSGLVRCAVAVDMLGEGINFPNVKLLAYHDKHKSTAPTMQILGRLARVSDSVAVRGLLITVADQDIYPAIQDAVRDLYQEDADWVELLPNLIDEYVEADRANVEFARAFGDSSKLKLDCLHPVGRAVVHEYQPTIQFTDMLTSGKLPPELQPNELLWGNEYVLYSGVHREDALVVVVTCNVRRPSWYREDVSLDSPTYGLHIVAWRPRRDGATGLLIVNSDDTRIGRLIRDCLVGSSEVRLANAERLQASFDSLERVGVSSVGVRNVFAGVRGAPSYATFGGSRVEHGLRASDTDNRALGHVMAQVRTSDGTTTTAGLATEKGKMWQARYLSLRDFAGFCSALAEDYWQPAASSSGPLLPTVARGVRLDAFPRGPLVATLHEGWLNSDRTLAGGLSLGGLDIHASEPIDDGRKLPIDLIVEVTGEVVWSGEQLIDGSFTSADTELRSLRGYSDSRPLSATLEDLPPTIHFLNGETVTGAMLHKPVVARADLPMFQRSFWSWIDVDIAHETPHEDAIGIPVHAAVEERLRGQRTKGALRWVLCNDGKGEIADHIVFEIRPNDQPRVELWHSKGAGGDPGVRVTDMQVLVAQAVKSRRHFHDPEFWHRLGRRLDGREGPVLRIVSGPGLRLLRGVLGLLPEHTALSIADSNRPIVGKVVMVQPGLSLDSLRQQLTREHPELASQQVRELLTIAHDACTGHGVELELIASA